MLRQPLRIRATVVSLVACSVVVVCVAAPARGQDDPRAKKGQVQGQQTAVASQINVLEASAADVQAGLASVQAEVAAAEASVAAAQAAVDAATASLTAAKANQEVAQREVDERMRRLRELAIDSYVNADARTLELAVALAPSSNEDLQLLRGSLAGFRADQEGLALQRLAAAEATLAAATAAAESAAADADGKKAAAQGQADGLLSSRNQQAGYANAVERRLDDKLAEAAALRSLDRQLSDKIIADEQALAKQVDKPAAAPGPKKASSPPPPPPGAESVAPPPSPAHPDLTTTHGITVARSIADELGAMIDAAAADGVKLTGSGYRDYASQVALRRQNCGTSNYDIYERPASECSPPTARPGASRHEEGLAVDIAANGKVITSHADAGWSWLNAHARGYGFFNLGSEPWHWSVDGQ
ncbi:MAG: D-alanyl-D-alanine carboxypeptidase family protein [Acidimicrobiales bacterium]